MSAADEDLILNYLTVQNRPYNLQTVVDNLKGAIKKGAAQKAIDNLVQKGAVKAKEYSKQMIYRNK
jgi:hypothetical protein